MTEYQATISWTANYSRGLTGNYRRSMNRTTTTQQTAAAIRDAITRGDYPAGTRLPNGVDLATQHGTSATVVYDALRMLANEGLVTAVRRGGTWVREAADITVITRDRGVLADARGYYFDAAAKDWESVLRTTIVSWSIPAPDIAAILGSGNSPVLIRNRAVGPVGSRRAEQLAVSHIDPAIGHDLSLDVPHTGPGGIYARLEDAGYRLDWTERVGARMPAPEEARELACPRGVPLLRVLRVTSVRREREHQVASVDEILQRADRYAYAYRLKR